MNRLHTTLCLSLAVFFTACSSDSGDDNPTTGDTSVAEDSDGTPDNGTGDGSATGDTPSTGGTGDDSNNSSAVASSCSDSQSFDIPVGNDVTTATSATITSESGADGDILFDCKGKRFSLTPGISSLNIIDVQQHDDIDSSCRSGNKVKGSVKSDYKTGVITYSGTLNGETFSCSDTYISPLEAEVSNDASISKLLLNWGVDETGDDFISTTCPKGRDEAFTDSNPITCSGTFSNNYTIMDSEGKTHRLSTKTSVSFQ